MQVFLLILLVVATSASLSEIRQFQTYKQTYGKIYKNQVEESKRFNIFKEKLRVVKEHNALYEDGLVSYKKGVNKFTDMTHDEFEGLLSLSSSKKPNLKGTQYVKTGMAVPKSVDWRNSGQVGPVLGQGSCGSCWAFSLTGASEAAYFRKTGKLVTFSKQQLIDCAEDPDDGCNGGMLEETYPYLAKFGHQTEESYPYEAITRKCRYNSSKVVTNVTDYIQIDEGDEEALLEAVGSVGPVAIAMHARYLFDYSSGIYSDEDCNPFILDHAILAVGYGTENGLDYWIVKNSWGAEWGENGYFRIQRGTNECGIAEDNVYPILN